MKNKFFVIFFLSFSIFLYAEQIRIMSFNIGANSSKHDANDTEWISRIADVIILSSADIILLQEVPVRSDSDLKTEFLRRLKDKLVEKGSSKSWTAFSTYSYIFKYRDSNNRPKLNSAILYDYSKFTVFQNGRYPIDFRIESASKKYGNYFNNLQFAHIWFNSNRSKKFRLINVHTHAANGSVFERQNDLDSIKNIIQDYGLSFPVIIAGDMNLNSDQIKRKLSFSSYKIDNNKSIKTSLSSTKNNSDCIKMSEENRGEYDHFIYNMLVSPISDIKNVLTGTTDVGKNMYSSGEIKLGNESFQSGNDYREKLSDHFPIMMDFEI